MPAAGRTLSLLPSPSRLAALVEGTPGTSRSCRRPSIPQARGRGCIREVEAVLTEQGRCADPLHPKYVQSRTDARHSRNPTHAQLPPRVYYRRSKSCRIRHSFASGDSVANIRRGVVFVQTRLCVQVSYTEARPESPSQLCFVTLRQEGCTGTLVSAAKWPCHLLLFHHTGTSSYRTILIHLVLPHTCFVFLQDCLPCQWLQ